VGLRCRACDAAQHLKSQVASALGYSSDLNEATEHKACVLAAWGAQGCRHAVLARCRWVSNQGQHLSTACSTFTDNVSCGQP
jgi:hypothetical protein